MVTKKLFCDTLSVVDSFLTKSIDSLTKYSNSWKHGCKWWLTYCKILVERQFTELKTGLPGLPSFWIFSCLQKFGVLASRVCRFFAVLSSRSLCSLSSFIVLFTLFLLDSVESCWVFCYRSLLLSCRLDSRM